MSLTNTIWCVLQSGMTAIIISHLLLLKCRKIWKFMVQRAQGLYLNLYKHLFETVIPIIPDEFTLERGVAFSLKWILFLLGVWSKNNFQLLPLIIILKNRWNIARRRNYIQSCSPFQSWMFLKMSANINMCRLQPQIKVKQICCKLPTQQ